MEELAREKRYFERNYQAWRTKKYDDESFDFLFDISQTISRAHSDSILRYIAYAIAKGENESLYVGYAAAGAPENYVEAIVRAGDTVEARYLYEDKGFKWMFDEGLIWGDRDKFLTMVR